MNNKEKFKKENPHLEEWSGLSVDAISKIILRTSGFLEGIEGLKQNPEVSSRINLSELRLVQLLLRVVFSLECKVLDQEDEIEKYKKFQNENNELHRLLGDATLELTKAKEELEGLQNEEQPMRCVRKKSRFSGESLQAQEDNA